MPVVFLGVFAALCWSVHDLFARSLAVRVGPFRMALFVMLAGGLLLTGFVLANGSVWTASRPGLWLAAGLGAAYGLGIAGLFKAFSLGPVSVVAPITAAYPLLVFLWGVTNGLDPTPLQWLATATTLAGGIVVARAKGRGGGISAIEKGRLARLLVYCALACLGLAASVVFGQNAAVALGEVEAAWVSRPIAVLALLPFIGGEAAAPRLLPRHWLAMLVMGTLDVLGVVAINASGHLPGREFAAVGISAYGALAVVLAMLVLKEKVAPWQWLGIMLIVVGVATLSMSG